MFSESKVTVEDTLKMLEAVKIRHSLTQAAVSDLFKLVKVLAGPRFCDLEISEYYLKKFNTPQNVKKIYSFYCTKCELPLVESCTMEELKKIKSKKCEKCLETFVLETSKKNYFVNVSLEYQIRSILKDKKIAHSVIETYEKNRFNTHHRRGAENDLVYRDTFDGRLYKVNEFIHVRDPRDVVMTLNINIDGAAMFHKTKYSLWPILCQINELDKKLRFKIVLAGAVWYTDKEPTAAKMQMYVSNFLKQIEELNNTGINIKYKGQTRRIYVLPYLFPVDAIARSIIANRVGVSGYYGCHWCYNPGVWKFNHVRFPLKKEPGSKIHKLRSHQLYTQDAEEFSNLTDEEKRDKKSIRGVKGKVSWFDEIPGFDAIYSFPEEYMHSIGLGVIKQFDCFITSPSTYENNLKPATMKKINERLIKIRPPHDLYRFPEQLTNKSVWKAADYLYYLLFYAIPCLEDFLDEEALFPLFLLNKSLFTLLDDEITFESLMGCEKDLVLFVTICEEIFDLGFSTSNVCALLHLCKSVENCGPLWASSAFVHESKIYQLKMSTHGPTRITEQIADRILEYYDYRNKLTNIKEEDEVSIFCKNIFFKRKAGTTNNKKIIDEHTSLYTNHCKKENAFSRCYYKEILYSSKEYELSKKNDDSVVLLKNGQFGRINYFFLDNTSVTMNFEQFVTEPYQLNGHVSKNIFKVIGRSIEPKVKISDIQKKCVHIDLRKEFVVIPPSFYDVK